jgi:hypothetical protein
MTQPTWRPYHEECPNCGCEAEILTTSGADYVAFDGDKVRCSECGMPGVVSADEGGAYVAWHADPACDCAWCKAHALVINSEE